MGLRVRRLARTLLGGKREQRAYCLLRERQGTVVRVEQADTANIVAAVRRAAARTGTDFGFLLAQARSESGLRPDAAATTSSARGLFQFTEGTWLGVVKKHGAAHGMAWAAKAARSVDNAAEVVSSGGNAARRAVLALRDSPDAASLMAGEFVKDNAALLERKLGRAANTAELHMASFLGAGGAATFLKALAASPGVAAAAVVPAAAAANRSIFYARDGAARSLDAVMRLMAAKIGDVAAPAGPGGVNLPPAGQSLPQGGGLLPTSGLALPEAGMTGPQAMMAYLLLAELGA